MHVFGNSDIFVFPVYPFPTNGKGMKPPKLQKKSVRGNRRTYQRLEEIACHSSRKERSFMLILSCLK